MWQWLLAANLLMPVSYAGETITIGPPQGAGPSPSLSFCQQRFYEEDDGRLLCNWAVNFNFACFVSYPSNKVLQAGSKLSEPEVVGECDNGEPIIKLLHY
ncbi:hypothetical protein [Microbulbifer hainanensis]|uniref:hypothetical protein n=1 Tax=Microbulbifer hainanensis TaxID=2735675 RepID=UPI0018692FE1|nr:hypothetical protein [Microbulbifer hainanensis]